ncbi:MAG: glucose-1-phosphate cytidylyltransferase [Proteobacteria bacterium]|nr:glucose-1-phosphate cytidylyltransferase [Pseudomonadota bacterium]
MSIKKAVILAGGLGTRLSEETSLRPKPMVQIGNHPILWHIMKIYSAYGIDEFIVCLGYKGYMIKEYFANYFLHVSDVIFDIANNEMEVLQHSAEPWKIALVDTGRDTMTGGRLKRVREYIGDEDFCFTYGDGLADIDIAKLMRFHKRQGRLATVTATLAPGRFGALEVAGHLVTAFREKAAGGWINGGFFVLSPRCIDYIAGDTTTWENDPLEALARERQLAVYKHDGFWHPMDTLRDKRKLENLWASGKAPWKKW